MVNDAFAKFISVAQVLEYLTDNVSSIVAALALGQPKCHPRGKMRVVAPGHKEVAHEASPQGCRQTRVVEVSVQVVDKVCAYRVAYQVMNERICRIEAV